MEPVKLGIIGIGRWAVDVHLQNLKRIPDARVTALASRSPENLRRGLDAASPGARGFADYHELLADPDVDAVIVSTPNDLHEPISLEALAAGKHVLCEKPASLSVEGCDRLIAAQRSSGKVVGVGLELRCADVCRRLHSLVSDGAIGPPVMIWVNILRDWGGASGWRASRARSGGIYYELGCHYLDLFNWLAGSAPRQVSAAGGSILGTDWADHLWTTVRYEGGTVANLGICVFAPARDEEIRLEMVGPNGRLIGEVIAGKVWHWKRGEKEPRDVSPARPADYQFFGFPGSYESLVEYVEAVRSGGPPPVDLTQARLATAVSEAADRALRESRAVSLSEVEA